MTSCDFIDEMLRHARFTKFLYFQRPSSDYDFMHVNALSKVVGILMYALVFSDGDYRLGGLLCKGAF